MGNIFGKVGIRIGADISASYCTNALMQTYTLKEATEKLIVKNALGESTTRYDYDKTMVATFTYAVANTVLNASASIVKPGAGVPIAIIDNMTGGAMPTGSFITDDTEVSAANDKATEVTVASTWYQGMQ
jgi:hypothetical protein